MAAGHRALLLVAAVLVAAVAFASARESKTAIPSPIGTFQGDSHSDDTTADAAAAPATAGEEAPPVAAASLGPVAAHIGVVAALAVVVFPF